MNYHNNNSKKEEPLDGLIKMPLPYQAPTDYFEGLPGVLLSSVAAANSVTDPDTAFLPRHNVFFLPNEYFETFPAAVLTKAKEAEEIIEKGKYNWHDAGKSLPYQLPEGYFEHFEAKLSHKLFHSEAEIEALPALLSDLRKAQPMTVPEDYFTEDITTRVIPGKPEIKNKTSEHPSVRSIRWTSWVAAAAVLFIIGMGGWHFLTPSGSTSGTTFEQRLAQIPKSDIQNYINNNLEEFDINMIENSISQTAKNNMAASALSGISDADIEAYLNEDI